jgi:putative ABC transport system permease protein
MEMALPNVKYPSETNPSYLGGESTVNFFQEVNRRIAQLPGVEFSAATMILPLSGSNSDSSFAIEGREMRPNDPGPDEEVRTITPDYFRVLQTPLIAGRFFNESDTAGSTPVAIVNQALARKYWPNENAVGKRITFDDPTKNPKWITIVGIVGNIHHRGLDVDSQPEYYTPHSQFPIRAMILAVRSTQDPRSLTSAIRREILSLDPDQPIANVRTLEAVVTDSVAPRRLSVVLLGVFAGIALLLAAVGTYGVISYLVVQRTHEIGVRMALGAQRRDVLALVVGHALKLVGIGTLLGLILALFSTRTLSTLLYSVSAFDVTTFVLVTLVLAGIALLASYIPALRATRADPMIALSHNT